MNHEEWLKWKELDDKFKQLEEFGNQEDLPFIMSFGDDLCIDGHFTKEQLLILANKILEVLQ